MLSVLFQIGLGFGGFSQIIQNMTNLGFFQFLFPFLLALAIFYGVLHMALGDKLPKSAVSLISLILAFFVMLFASANPGIVQFFQNISGIGLIVGTGILFIVILLGLTGFKISDLIIGKDKSDGERLLLLLIVIVGIIIFFGASTSQFLPGVVIGSDFFTIIFFIVILAIVLWFLGRKDETDKKSAPAGK